MARTTRCPKCESSSFELATGTRVQGSGHAIYFVQCASCGCAITAMSAREIHLIEQIAKKVSAS